MTSAFASLDCTLDLARAVLLCDGAGRSDGAGHCGGRRQGAAVGLLVGTLIHGQERVEEPLREAILQVRPATLNISMPTLLQQSVW